MIQASTHPDTSLPTGTTTDTPWSWQYLPTASREGEAPPAAKTWFPVHKMHVVTDALPSSQDYQEVTRVRFPRQPVVGISGRWRARKNGDRSLEGEGQLGQPGLCHSAML